MSDLWRDEELAAAVRAYREMQSHQAAGRKYSKAEYYRELSARYGRTEKAFEFRMQNISAVLEAMGEPWLLGLNPAKHVGGRVGRRLVDLLSEQNAGAPEPETKVLFKEKLPLIRHWLASVALSHALVTNEQMLQVFGLDSISLRDALEHLGRESKQLGEPIISSLVVSESTGRCAEDFCKAFVISDEDAEREQVRAYWARQSSNQAAQPNSVPNESTEVRAIRFATVARRPDQAAFRKAVFEAHGGRCAITGCGVGAALDAAHKHGCNWKEGHNGSADGLLLRKDLHALYDRHLLTIDANGLIGLSEEVLPHYPELAGMRIDV